MTTRTAASSLLAAIIIGTTLVTTTAAAQADPRPAPWVQGQIDARTEDAPGFLNSINASGVDYDDINDPDLVIAGPKICYQIYSGRGDVSGAALPTPDPTTSTSWKSSPGASVKYLCPSAPPYVGQNILNAAPLNNAEHRQFSDKLPDPVDTQIDWATSSPSPFCPVSTNRKFAVRLHFSIRRERLISLVIADSHGITERR